MTKSLYGKLVAALCALVGLMSLVYLALSVYTSQLYLQEVNQKLNHGLAANILAESPLLGEGEVDEAALKALFHTLMVVNPSIEVYLVDAGGRILAYNAPPGTVKRERVALAPIERFLAGGEAFPIRGDDPRNPDGDKVFSAAPIDGGRLEGYLYVVLGGQEFESVARMIQGSYVLRLAVAIAVAGLLASLVLGVLSFNWLTRRLRRLSAGVEAFKRREFRSPVRLGSWRRHTRGDEIDQLGLAVEQMSQRIVDQLRQLRQVDASRREMIANISHDLRTPLTSLQAYLETLLLKTEEGLSEPEKKQYLELALKHSRRLTQLVAELFELAMLESRSRELHFEPFSIAELVQDVSLKFKLAAEKAAVSLATDIPASSPFVSGDIALIERVLENLIENAIKNTPAGGSIRLRVVPEPEGVATRVEDTGRGIPREDLPRIFDRFYRAGISGGEDPQGTGLGLAIAQRIVQLHGSPIEVESQPGAGTRFTFKLPLPATRTATTGPAG